jgi:hypothetical protein
VTYLAARYCSSSTGTRRSLGQVDEPSCHLLPRGHEKPRNCPAIELGTSAWRSPFDLGQVRLGCRGSGMAEGNPDPP